ELGGPCLLQAFQETPDDEDQLFRLLGRRKVSAAREPFYSRSWNACGCGADGLGGNDSIFLASHEQGGYAQAIKSGTEGFQARALQKSPVGGPAHNIQKKIAQVCRELGGTVIRSLQEEIGRC